MIMAEHTITLSESIYQSLLEEAQAKGISLDDWIKVKLAATADLIEPASEFPPDSAGSIGDKDDSRIKAYKGSKFITPASEISQKPLSELLSGFIGIVHSGTNNQQTNKKADPYGDALAEKFAKQGIHLP